MYLLFFNLEVEIHVTGSISIKYTSIICSAISIYSKICAHVLFITSQKRNFHMIFVD